MLEALTHAIVHMVALRCNDPVIPLDIFKIDVEFSLTAHTYIFTTTYRALPERVFGVVFSETQLGSQEGLVEGVGRAIQGAKVLPILIAVYLQTQFVPGPFQKGLQGAGDGEGVPVTHLDLQHLFHHQGAVSSWHPSFCREKNLSREAGVSMAVLRGADIDPQRRLEHLDILPLLL